jgi:resuscitation-promoting factor RpfB
MTSRRRIAVLLAVAAAAAFWGYSQGLSEAADSPTGLADTFAPSIITPTPTPSPSPTPKPTPRPARRTPTPSKPAVNVGSSVSGDVWQRLAWCESRGNPRAVSPSGRYFGLYQFSLSTWRSVGGSGNPIDASPAEQLARAKALQARSGWGQWPDCSRRLGLR